jgi:hypothetical protein
VRFSAEQAKELAELQKSTRIPLSTMIGLAVDALLDHVRRTGRMPLPKAKRKPWSKQ